MGNLALPPPGNRGGRSPCGVSSALGSTAGSEAVSLPQSRLRSPQP